MSLLTVSGISSSYGQKTVLSSISFTVEAGQFVGILGENGCGKTTLLKCIVTAKDYSGQCYMNLAGKQLDLKTININSIPDYLAYMPQTSGIAVDMMALDVVLMAFYSKLSIFEKPDDIMIEKAKLALELVGIADKANNMYFELSQGQKQMVSLARLLASEGHMLVLDEPESAIDFAKRNKVFKLIRNWTIAKADRCSIASLHDPALALNVCDKLILLKDGIVQGEIDTKNSSSDEMASKLSNIFGELSIKEIELYGKKQFVVLGNNQ